MLIGGRFSHYLMESNGSAGYRALVVMTREVSRVDKAKWLPGNEINSGGENKKK